MANTYTLISSNVLASSAASVTFSAIPSTYTDLVLRISTRVDRAINGSHNCQLTVNGSATSDYSQTNLAEFGVTINSTRASAGTFITTASTGNSTTANTFSSNEFYFANYAGSTNKPLSVTDVVENNSSADFESQIAARAGLRSNTAAITSITLNTNGYNYLTGSSFYLYGLKSS
jgi:hypothetical protein